MPVRRDADGNIIDEATRQQGRSAPGGGERGWAQATGRTADIAGPTVPRPGANPATFRSGAGKADRHGAPTSPARRRPAGSDRDSGRTQIYRPNQPDAEMGTGAGPMNDPPVGWLVIVGGPGMGHVATIGMGVNAIGRDATDRVSLDYGDKMISRTRHALVTFDPRSRKFYIQHGGGTNLTYLNDEPVLAPRELEPLTHVQIGDTVLRFVPLCGADFCWDDQSGDR